MLRALFEWLSLPIEAGEGSAIPISPERVQDQMQNRTAPTRSARRSDHSKAVLARKTDHAAPDPTASTRSGMAALANRRCSRETAVRSLLTTLFPASSRSLETRGDPSIQAEAPRIYRRSFRSGAGCQPDPCANGAGSHECVRVGRPG